MKPYRVFLLLIYTPWGKLFQYAWFRMKLFFVRSRLFPMLRTVQEASPLRIDPEHSEVDFIRGDEFTFLNRSVNFKGKVDWDFQEHGMLWKFHLHSFEYLRQESLGKERALKLMEEFCRYEQETPASFEPYTASLRIINWVKFLSLHRESGKGYSRSLLSLALKLSHTIEWHLQNNHLMENAFALLYAGVYFRNEKLFRKGKSVLEKEITKQILPDGAHFELSPMYHLLMLFRFLGCIEMLNKNKPEEKKFEGKLITAASRMLGWMKEIRFENGDMPAVNDSAEGIAPTPGAILDYARRLNVPVQKVILKECGFRKYKSETYECLVDVGGLDPQANAGHAHADSLSFILYVHNEPFIIDTGTSTYENNSTRKYERSTPAHNTVSAGNRSQSSLWDSFRVGKRSKIVGINQGNDFVESSIRFFDNSMLHNRRFEFSKNSIIIRDDVSGENLEAAKSFLYVNKIPEIVQVNSKLNADIATIEFSGEQKINVDEAFAAREFNKSFRCSRLTIQFKRGLITTFTFHNSILSGR